MKTITFIASLMLIARLFSGCSNNGIDQEPPTIDIDFAGAFPVQCGELRRGETFVVKARLSDNVALGSYTINIHHNFDHHNHSTEVNECQFGEKKEPENPFRLMRTYDNIPSDATQYETGVSIDVPDNVDPGDYHFMLTVTDKNGWSEMIGLSVKIN